MASTRTVYSPEPIVFLPDQGLLFHRNAEKLLGQQGISLLLFASIDLKHLFFVVNQFTLHVNNFAERDRCR